MSKTEWTIISVLGISILVVLAFLLILVLGMLLTSPSPTSPVVGLAATATAEPTRAPEKATAAPSPIRSPGATAASEQPTRSPEKATAAPYTSAPGVTETTRPITTELSITPRALYSLGSAAPVENWEYKVTKVDKVKTFVWSEFGNTTEAKGIFLVVYLTLKNTSSKTSSINPWDFELRDAGQAKYDTSNAAGVYSFVEFSKLTNIGDRFAPGVILNTALIFDINPNAKGLTLFLRQGQVSIDLAQ
jgi:hypothetical protein